MNLLIKVKSQNTDVAEILFMQMTCGREKATIGLVYAPQEKDTSVEELDTMHKFIEEEISQARLDNHIVIVGGDFNGKIGDAIEGNKKEVSKAGRRLIKMAKNNSMKILNTTDKCKGKWTRIQKEKTRTVHSAIDYILISEEHESCVIDMTVDENKDITPYRDDSAYGKPVYTDHNMITVNLNLILTKSTDEPRIDRKKFEKFQEKTEDTNLIEIWNGAEQENIQEKYTPWSKRVYQIALATCPQKQKKNVEKKEVKIMRRKRRILKIQMRNESKKDIRDIIQKRRKMIQQHIIQAKRKNNKEKVKAVAMNIKNKGIFNRTAYWDFMRSMRKKRTIKGTAVNDKDGKRIDDPAKVKDRYLQYFKDLLSVRKAENDEEKMVEESVDKCIAAMEKTSLNLEIAPVTDVEYEIMKKSLKKQKANDADGWMYEMIIYAGKDLEESIKIMINAVLKTKTMPEEWNIMDILPIDKTNGYLEMTQKRGLFLTNIISKCVEKILFKRREKSLISNISTHQCGGVTERSIQDNLFIVNHTIYRYKKERKNLYMLFADIEKCFDNLWLKDCIIELVRCGTPVEEAMFIYNMNKKSPSKSEYTSWRH